MRGLILSAGLGERLRPLTLKRAKPAVEILNMPMLAFPYYWLDSVGLSDVVFNTHYLPDTVRHAAMHAVNPSAQLHFTHEDAILGSGGGIWNARFHLQWDADFAVANGDGVVVFEDDDTIEQMLKFHREKNALATMLVCPLAGVGVDRGGVWLDKYGEVGNFGKEPRKDYLECLHYASIMFFSERIWKYLPDGPSNILYDVVDSAISQGEKVYGYRVDNMNWFETGNATDYLAATQILLEQLREGGRKGQSLKRMLDRFAPMHTLHSEFTKLRLIDDACELSDSAVLRGFIVAGADAKIDAGAELENCVVLPGAHVAAGKYSTAVLI